MNATMTRTAHRALIISVLPDADRVRIGRDGRVHALVAGQGWRFAGYEEALLEMAEQDAAWRAHDADANGYDA